MFWGVDAKLANSARPEAPKSKALALVGQLANSAPECGPEYVAKQAEAGAVSGAPARSLPQQQRPQHRRATFGFLPRSELLHRLYNATLAGGLFVLALPLIGFISLLVYLTQGRPIFYRGLRTGQRGKPFEILKFRTLDTATAAMLTRDRVLPNGSGLETPLGGFLRETRLDELPQLLNVLRGDMNICGPRPVRPEIANMHRSKIRNYDARFNVKPGLLGPAQAFMGHGTPKAVRARLNAAMCSNPVSYRREFEMILLVPSCVIAKAFSIFISKLLAIGRKPDVQHPVGNLAAETGVDVQYCCDGSGLYPVLRIDEAHILLSEGCVAGPGALIITLPNGVKRMARICSERKVLGATGQWVLRYKPASDYSHHILERYLLQRVVVPHHSHFLPWRVIRALRRKFGGIGRSPGLATLPEQRAKR